MVGDLYLNGAGSLRCKVEAGRGLKAEVGETSRRRGADTTETCIVQVAWFGEGGEGSENLGFVTIRVSPGVVILRVVQRSRPRPAAILANPQAQHLTVDHNAFLTLPCFVHIFQVYLVRHDAITVRLRDVRHGMRRRENAVLNFAGPDFAQEAAAPRFLKAMPLLSL
jgi:hypothetical protein